MRRNSNPCKNPMSNHFIRQFRVRLKQAARARKFSSDKMTNKLKDEKSPYLLQHQHNPVDWHPWTPTTLDLAKTTHKPIFLSSGYSTCHWCHVMERESFENPVIAAIMNKHFINIKLDREEHPDIDRIYMTFIQAMSGSGGWPMSVWMTPELKPFYGGTYFPPEDRYYGRPGFKALLLSIAEQWAENEAACVASSNKITEVLLKNSVLPVATALPSDAGKKCLAQLSRSYEPAYGGFSEQPKFPQPVNLQFLIHYARVEGDCFKMADKTLRMMRRGGIWDQLGEGFCRYSTDKQWHVPHFEKMLYDQAQLASAYLNAYLASKDEFFSRVVREILDYVCRDMSTEEGGFYSAEDADSLPTPQSEHKAEGAFYVWEKGEIEQVLKDLSNDRGSDLFCQRYGVKVDGNVDPFQDPHDELKKKNVLFEAKDIETLAKEFSIPVNEVLSILAKAKQMLLTHRKQRPRPHLDNKCIASWNGLMISAFAQAGFALGEEAYVDRAVKAIHFIENNFFVDGKFLRTCYFDGGLVTNLQSPIGACVDDFCNVIAAYLDLFRAKGDVKFLKKAMEMQEKQDELFWDDEQGGYFNGVEDSSSIVRMKDDDDGAEPSSNSTSLLNLMRLNSASTKILKLLFQFSDRLNKIPITLPLMTCGLLSYQRGVTSIVIVGNDVRSSEMFQHLRTQLIPAGGIILAVDSSQDNEELKQLVPGLEGKLASCSEVKAYLKRGDVETEVTCVEDLIKFLEGN